MRYDFEGMPPLQAIVDTMNRSWQKTRAESQMTLGDLIERLEALPRELKIAGIENPHSYRGYYCDLAFEASENSVSVGEQLEVCHEAMGKVFEGYKGGDFMMGENTPVWVAYYGDVGLRLVEVKDDGTMILYPEDTE